MSPFRVAAAQCIKIEPERLNWPGRLSSLKGLVQFQNNNNNNNKRKCRPLFTIIFKPKMVISRVKSLVYLLIKWVVGGVSRKFYDSKHFPIYEASLQKWLKCSCLVGGPLLLLHSTIFFAYECLERFLIRF